MTRLPTPKKLRISHSYGNVELNIGNWHTGLVSILMMTLDSLQISWDSKIVERKS